MPAKFEEGTIESVLARISNFQTSGDLMLPKNYNPENAVRAAWLVLLETKDRSEKPALEVCTKASISTAMLDMVLKGLSVVKKQGYFVVYGNKLVFEESYIGTMAIAKREADVKDVNAVVIYEGDDFQYSIDQKTGRKTVVKHDQKLENIDPAKIRGAYAIVEFNDGTIKTEIMTMPQIRNAWSMGGAKGNSKAHNLFPDQMAAKTVIGRALKLEIGSSDDSALYEDQYAEGVKHEIKENANKKSIGFDRQPPAEKSTDPTPKPAQVSMPQHEYVEPMQETESVTKQGPDF